MSELAPWLPLFTKSSGELLRLDQACPGNQTIVDGVTLQCVMPCSDDSRPYNGICGSPNSWAAQPTSAKVFLGAVALGGLWYLTKKKGRGRRRR